MTSDSGGRRPLSPLAPRDARKCAELSTEAGWNQIPEDWSFLIRSGRGRCVRDAAGRPVATTVTLAYGGTVAWIGMVLVSPEYRGRGYARALMEDALQHAESSGLTPALDATPMGHPLYEKLGFQRVCGLSRWRLEPPSRAAGTAHPLTRAHRKDVAPPGSTNGFRACASAAELTSRDVAAAGLARPELWHELCSRSRTVAWCGPGDAFAVLRRGRLAWELGPVVVADAGSLSAVLGLAIHARRGEPVVIDCFDDHEPAATALRERGFVRVRSFVRMTLGASAAFRRGHELMATAGPEYG